MPVYVNEPTGLDELANRASGAASGAVKAGMDWTRRVNPLLERQMNDAAGNGGMAADGTGEASKDHGFDARAYRAHPVFKKVMEKYAEALSNGTVKAEDVYKELQAELRLFKQQTAPVQDTTVPVTQPASGDQPVLGKPAVQDVGTPEAVGALEGAVKGRGVDMPTAMPQGPQPTPETPPIPMGGAQGVGGGGGGGSFPSAAPGTGPSLAQPMQQANGVASGVMAGQMQSPQVQRPASVSALQHSDGGMPVSQFQQADGPVLARHGAPVQKEQVPIYERELPQFQNMTGYLSAMQRPAMQEQKAADKRVMAKEAADAKMRLEAMKQGGQNSRLVARLDTMLNVAQATNNEQTQRTAAHMTETLLNLEGGLMRMQETLAARERMKEGDWKVEMAKIAKGYSANAEKVLGMLANSMNLVISPEVQNYLIEQQQRVQQAKDAADAVVQEIGDERGSPALSTGKTDGEYPKARTETKPAATDESPPPKPNKKKAKKDEAPPPKKADKGGKKYKTRIDPATGDIVKVEE